MELIKELDAVLRYGFTSQVEPPKPGDNRKRRSNSFFGGGKPAAPKPKDTRKRANSFTGFFSSRPEAQPPTTATPTVDRQTQRKLLEQQRRQTQENAKRAAEMEVKMRQAAVQKARLQLMSERAKKAAASSLLPGVADTAQFSPPHKLQQRPAEPEPQHAGKLHSPSRPFFASADVPQQIPEPLAVAPARSLYRDGVTSPERAAVTSQLPPQQPRPTADAQARQSKDLLPPPRPSPEIGGLDDEASGSGDASSDRGGSQLFEELESPREITSADVARARAVSSSDSSGSEQQAAGLTAGGFDVAAPALTRRRAPIMPDELSAPMSPGGDVGMAPPQPGRADFVSPNRVRHDMKRKLMQAASQQQQDQLNAMMTMFDTVADADEGKQSERAPARESEAPAHNTQAPTTALGPGAPGSDQGSSGDAVAAVQPTGPSRAEPYFASSAAAAPPPPPPPELTAAPNTQPSVMITDAAEVDGPVQLDNPMAVLQALETPKRKIRVSRAAARLRAAAVKGIRTQVHEAYLTAHQKAQQQKQLHHTTAHEVALELVERQRVQAFAMLARKRQEEDTNRGLYTTKKRAVRTKDSILISF